MNEYYQKYLKYKKKYIDLKIQKSGYDEMDYIIKTKMQIHNKIDAVTEDIEGLENVLPQFTPEQEKYSAHLFYDSLWCTLEGPSHLRLFAS